jgi:hypothetical protein
MVGGVWLLVGIVTDTKRAKGADSGPLRAEIQRKIHAEKRSEVGASEVGGV